MKFNATLCSTNGNEPWAANVNMIFTGEEITTELKTNYAHYKNIVYNSKVVIALKSPVFEVLIKASASVKKLEGGTATVLIRPTWVRLVENGNTVDVIGSTEITDILTQKLS